MRIAIVGSHGATKQLAPYSDTAWAIWSCSFRNESELPRHDVWFELHDMEDERIRGEGGQVYYDWLRQQPIVYMQRPFDEFPDATVYPVDRVVREFGPDFLLNTICYMLALAILADPDAIGLYGISAVPEYAKYRPGILHFVQVARDRGIEIVVPKRAKDILKPPALIPGPVEW